MVDIISSQQQPAAASSSQQHQPESASSIQQLQPAASAAAPAGSQQHQKPPPAHQCLCGNQRLPTATACYSLHRTSHAEGAQTAHSRHPGILQAARNIGDTPAWSTKSIVLPSLISSFNTFNCRATNPPEKQVRLQKIVENVVVRMLPAPRTKWSLSSPLSETQRSAGHFAY